MRISWLTVLVVCLRVGGSRLAAQVRHPLSARAGADAPPAFATGTWATRVPHGFSRTIGSSKPLSTDESVAVAIPLGLTCPLEGCAGHLYEALMQDSRRRLLCTDHRI